jgi:hypothetical protein
MAAIDFDYDLEEIVQMDGVGPVSLKSALWRMPDPIGPYGVLHRERGKTPAFSTLSEFKHCLTGTDQGSMRATHPATAKPTRTIFRPTRSSQFDRALSKHDPNYLDICPPDGDKQRPI